MAQITEGYQYTFDVEHCPGKDNELPEALSRFSHPRELSPGESDLERMVPPNYSDTQKSEQHEIPTLHLTHTPFLFDDVIDAQQEDPDINRDISDWLEIQQRERRTSEEEHFFQTHRLNEQGFWRISNDDQKWLMPVPLITRQRILWEYHDAPLSGHPGVVETLRSIREHFVWPGINRKVRRYVAGCHLCICCKPVLSNKATGYNAALVRPRIGPYQVVKQLSGKVYHILKDGHIQKVHGKDLWPALPQEPHHADVCAQLTVRPIPCILGGYLKK